ncbi:MAG TPA: LysR substrate-binding domain-containing protein [Bradyrhizobium sp.]|nr:LysR substrate-binding domain-containing protein [Bradyrhizobium sp.]
MNTRQLQLLVALDEQRNLARVAEQLNVTAPAVSKALRDIERELSTPLFRRGARGVAPTVYGDCMIRHARTVLAELSSASKELRALKDGTIGSVALGVLPAAAPRLAPLAIVELKKRAPFTSVLLREGTIDVLLPELQLRKLDAIVGNLPPPRIAAGLDLEVLINDDPIVVVCRTNHPLSRHRKMRWRHLLDYPWILPPPGTSVRESFEAFLASRREASTQNFIESGSIVSNKTYIEQTDALGFFSRQIAEHFAEQGKIGMLPFELGLRAAPVGAIWKKGLPLAPAVALVLDSLRLVAKSF